MPPNVPNDGKVDVESLTELLTKEAQTSFILTRNSDLWSQVSGFNSGQAPIRCVWSDDEKMPAFIQQQDKLNKVGFGWTAISFCVKSNVIAASIKYEVLTPWDILVLASEASLC